jgi:hypothetical protein
LTSNGLPPPLSGFDFCVIDDGLAVDVGARVDSESTLNVEGAAAGDVGSTMIAPVEDAAAAGVVDESTAEDEGATLLLSAAVLPGVEELLAAGGVGGGEGGGAEGVAV